MSDNNRSSLIGSLAQVTWVDTFGCPAGWEFQDDLNPGYTTVRSVGIVIALNDDFLCLAPHMSQPKGDGAVQVAGHITVPCRSIIEISGLDVAYNITASSCPVPE